MDYREIALEEIARRVKRDKLLLNLQSFKWDSNSPTNKINVPAIFMFEGVDTIKEHVSRNKIGYPSRRHLEVNIEMVIKSNPAELKLLYQKVRRSIFCNREDVIQDNVKSIVWTPNNTVAKNSYIVELKTEGPGAYVIPELIGMKIIIGLWYVDYGIYEENSRNVISV